MFIVRGVNIYPSHIDEILSREKGIGSEFQIHLDHQEDGKDYMVLKVEREDGGNPEADAALAARIERASGRRRSSAARWRSSITGASPGRNARRSASSTTGT